ncbi:MAG: DUF6785 family protein [Armatimonadota bacterium]|nr:DUF6785 family protein [Armatimonadota bacterium]
MTPHTNAEQQKAPLWRALVIGLVFALGGLYFGMYGYQIAQVLHWSTTSLQMGSVLILFVAVLLFALLRRLWRAFRLQTSELLIIYIISTITTAVGCHGMWGHLVPMMPAIRYYASPENEWLELLADVPSWVTVNDYSVIEPFYETGGTLYSLATLRAWATPLAFWIVFTSLMVVGTWALTKLVSEQWVSRERLTFPLAQLPLAMTGARLAGAFWRNRLMWAGFAIPMVLQSFNFINYLYPPFPTMWLKARPAGQSITAMPWVAMRPLYIAFYPFVIGLTYMLSTETALSCWLFYWVSKLEHVVCAALGLGRGGGAGITQLPLVNQQGTGALLTLAAAALLLAWQGVRRSPTSDRPEGVQVVSSHTSLIVLGGALLGLVGLTSAMGLPATIGAAYFLLRWLMGLAWARVSAETGSPWTFNLQAGIVNMFVTFTGTGVIPRRGLPMFATFSTFDNFSDSRAVQLIATHKFREEGEIPRSHLRTAVLVGIVASIVWAAWVHLDIYYRHGAAMAVVRGWYTSSGARPWHLLAGWLIRPESADVWEMGGYIWGGTMALALRTARLNVPSWPLHPIGYALGHTSVMRYMWMPFLIAWLIKASVLRYGGFKLHQRLTPLFMGLILGDVVVAGVWGVYGVATSTRMYMHFPH